MASEHGPQIKNDEMYEMLRDAGASKEKAARIANAQDNGTLNHDSRHLEDRTVKELYDEAQEIGIEGRSDMTKQELIDAIRDR
ncbi:Rho termination factor N-terminal domain-containing protein [Sphingomonas sp.]|uniref:DUF7218 family protein n=1 Tax=Sphingomonas sp. TaxID=28214 RepID=UPI001EB36177|nr:Rho termination factor N-terminal domain-containing protein [Sphingomonas sp.]MBX3594575.1 Rho termination factor N-terminal domain-containing protein [Sphingomonas sp.]